MPSTTPAFDEIWAITAPARQGVFAAPVGDQKPKLVPLRLERLAVANQPANVITVDRSGRASITESAEPVRTATLTTGQRDALRLLTPLLDAGPVPPCDSAEYYRVRFAGGQVRPDCSMRGRYPEFRALVGLLDGVFAQ